MGGQKPSVANTEAIESESITGCITGKDTLLVSPIIYWTEKDVWDFLNDVVQVPHCELYDKGWKRIGCLCCPMSTYKHRIREIEAYPHIKERWLSAIKKINISGGYIETENVHWLSSSDRPIDEEQEKAENIFDWWISGKGYKQWYADKFLQLKLFTEGKCP